MEYSSMREKLRKPLALNTILPSLFSKNPIPLTPKDLLYCLQHNWETIVGAPLHPHTFPQQVYGKRLVITVKGSVWANELQMMQPTILRKIQELLPKCPVTEIRFEVGK